LDISPINTPSRTKNMDTKVRMDSLRIICYE